jgi:hypothetical protein
MKRIISLVALLLSVSACNTTTPQPKPAYEPEQPNPFSESERQLRGARSIHFLINAYDEEGCKVGLAVENTLQVYKDRLPSNLKLDPKVGSSDLVATILIETTPRIDTGGKQICLFYFNLRLLHTMMGQLRYRESPALIQALVFNKSVYGATMPDLLSASAAMQTEKLLQMFLDTYYRANQLNNRQ